MEQLEPLVLLHFSTTEPVGQPDRIVTWPPTAGFKPYDNYFTKDSVRHPAKANLHMIKWIIETYTKEGDWILDPMAGTGSTGIIALLLGRNTILVEYEQKFVDMINANVLQLINMAPINPSLQWKVIKGDARKFAELLCDHIIFSPPYAESIGSRKDGQTERSKLHSNFQGGGRGFMEHQTGSPENIGNLPYGSVDSIVTSPPYSDNPIPFQDKNFKPPHDTTNLHRDRYSLNKNDLGNLGNLKSDTYLSAMLQVYSECFKVLKSNGLMILITKNFIRKKQIVRLDLDTIKLCEKAGFTLSDRWYRKLTNFSFWVTNYFKKYGLRVEYEDILVFQKNHNHNENNKIHSILFSPPYNTRISSGNPEQRKQRLLDAGYNPEEYMGGNARNLELKDYKGEW